MSNGISYEIYCFDYNKLCAWVQQKGADDFVKISAWEKGILAFTAAFLILTVGYFLGQRRGEPYSVSTQTLWTQEVAAGAEHTPTAIEPININTAGVDQLQSLPGIGQVRAEQIVADREENGEFRIPEDIMRVPGIGEGTLEEIIDYITVS